MTKKGTLSAVLVSLVVLLSLILTPLAFAQIALFSDNFSSGFVNWDSSTDWSISSGAARAREATNGDALQKNNISTLCYQDIYLVFDYAQEGVDSGEGVRVEWRVGSGSWNSLGLFRGSSSWQQSRTALDGAEGNANLQIRFVPVGLDSGWFPEYWYLDDVVVEGHPLENNSIGDYVFISADGPLAGATVELWNDNNYNGVVDGGDTIRATATTSSSPGANYDFTGLPAGNYVVRALAPAGYYPSSQDRAVSISGCGQDENGADFGFEPVATVNGRVYYDDDRDGSQSGDAGIAGVTVNISGGSISLSDLTDDNGNFEFDVPAGSYTLQVVEGTLPAGRTDLTAGTNPSSITAIAGDATTVNFGYDDSGRIGDWIWDDSDDGDGLPGGDPGLNGWTVSLENELGVTVHQATAAGAYDFVGLPPGVYYLTVTVPPGWTQTNFQEHPLAVNLAAGQDFNDGDFGFSDAHASLSGYVWYDPDRSGTRDAGEPGINGINVDLYRAGGYVGSVSSNTSGYYFFGGLTAGDYRVDVDATDPDLDPIWTLTTDDPQSVPGVVPTHAYGSYDFGFAEPPAAGKPLYLHSGDELTREEATGATDSVQLDHQEENTWTLTPLLAEDLVLTGDPIDIQLYIDPTTSNLGNAPDVHVWLNSGATGIGYDRVDNIESGQQLYTFSFAPGVTTIPADQALSLRVRVDGADGWPDDGNATVYFNSANAPSQVILPVYSYLHLQEATTYNGAYPSGVPLDVFLSGDTIYFRVTAADPFGHADITGATLTVPGVLNNVPMILRATPDNATAIYEYAHTGFGLGEHDYTITVAEGTEGEVVAVGTGTFRMIISDLTGSYKEVWNVTAGAPGDTAEPGDVLEYTVHIVNSGDADADAVYVTDPIPAHATCELGSVSGAEYNAALNAVVWDHAAQGIVPGLGERFFTFRVQLDPVLDNGLEIENTAQIDDGVNPEPFPRSIRTTIVSAPDLDHSSTTKEVMNYTTGLPGDTAEPGDELLYTLTLVNDGSMNSSASLSDPLPAHTTLVEGTVSVTAGNASYDAGRRTVLWNGTVPGGGGSVSISFRVLVDFPLDNDTLITNVASIDDGFAPNGTTPFQRQTVTTIISEPLLEAYSSKLVDEVTAEPGDTLHYTIYLVNGGKMDASSVSLVDPLPANTSYAGGLVASHGTAHWDGSQVTWTGAVNPGEVVEIRFRVTADPVLDDNLVIANTATVDDGYHVGTFDLEAETTIHSAPDLQDSYKTVSATTAQPGDSLDYEIQLVNAGNMVAPTTIVDTLSPDLVNVVVTSPAEANYDPGQHAILWTGQVAPGADVVIQFSADVRSPLDSPQTIIYNTARVNDGVHPPFNIFPPVQTTVHAEPDLETSTKAVDLAAANPGDVLEYTITLNNTGNMNAWVSVQDILPAHTTYVPNSLSFPDGTTGGYDDFNNWIVWEGLVAGGQAPLVLTYQVQVDAVMDEAQTTIYNDARIDDGEHSPFYTNGVTTLISAEPDLSTSTKVVDLDEAAPGQQLWYRITVANTGNMVAQGASVTDYLPAELTYLSGQFPTGGGYNSVARYVYWTGDVVPGEDVIIDYYVTVNNPLNNGTIIENTAEITDGFPTHDPIVTDPPAQTHITSAPNLGTSTKAVDRGTAAPGSILEYTITLNNTGNMNTTSATVVDTLPPDHVTLVATPPGAVYDAGAGTLTWTGLTVNRGVPVVLTFQVELDPVIPDQELIVNQVEINDGHNPDAVECQAMTIIGSAPNLSASTKAVDRPTAAPGDALVYTIRLHNTGNTNATVDLTDALPDNVSWAGWVTQNGAAYTAATETITWSGPVNAGAEEVLSYRVTLDLPLDNNTLVANTATVDDNIHTPFEIGPAQTTIQSTPDLRTSDKAVWNVTADAPGDTAAPGDVLEYTITLRNTGRMTAHSATMLDYLPDYVHVVGASWSATAGSVQYTPYNRRISWNGSVSPLEDVVITYRVTVDDALDDGTEIVNDATVGDGIHSPFDTGLVITVVGSAPNLTSSTKVVDRGTAEPGDQLRYTIQLVNTGNMVAQASMVDELPDHVTYFSGPSASAGSASWDRFNNRVLWTGSVYPGTPVTIEYYVTVNDPTDDGTEINNTCEIDDGYAGHDVYSPPETSTIVSSAPDLSTSTKAVDHTNAGPGDVLEYTVTLNNTGNQAARNAWLTDPLPAHSSWAGGLTWSGGGSATWDGSQVRWDGNVYPGTPVVLRFRVRLDDPLDDGTNIVNTATINDGFTGHDDLQHQATTTISSAPDLSTSTKAVNRSTAQPGEALDYTITLINTGSMVATGALMDDVLPADVTFESMLSPIGSYNPGANSVTWTGDVAPGTPVVIQYRVIIDNPLDNGTLITNRATIDDNFAGHSPFQTAATQTLIGSTPNLRTSIKQVDAATAAPGQIINYTITLNNTGSMNASAYVLDGIPVNTTYVPASANASSGSVTFDQYQNRIEWNGTVVVGEPVVIHYAVQIHTPLNNGTLIWNTATVGDGVHSPFETGAANTVVESAPNLAAHSSKTVNRADAAPGDLMRYTITLVNDGNMAAGNAQVVDGLPPDVTFHSGPFASSGSAAWDSFNRQVLWSGAVAPGTPVIIQYEVTVNTPLDDLTVIENQATVSDNFQGHDEFEVGPARTTIHSAPDLSTSTKAVNLTTAGPGDYLLYTVTLLNTGNMDAGNVSLTDELPALTSFVEIVVGGATYNAGLNRIEWHGPVTTGRPVVIQYRVQLDEVIEDGTLITNRATIVDGYPGHGPVETTEAVTVIGSAPDMSGSTKAVNETDAAPGEHLIYTITLTNDGNAVANASLDDTLPANTAWVGWVTQPSGAAWDGTTVTWAGSVEPGMDVTLAYEVAIGTPLDNGTIIANAATVDDGVNPALTIGPAQTTVHSAPDLTTSYKQVDLATAAPGQEIEYTLTIINSGDMLARNVSVYDTIPNLTQFVAGSEGASSGTVLYQTSYNRIRWQGEVAPGTPVVITFTVRLNWPLENGTSIINFATIDDGFHSTLDTGEVETIVAAYADLTNSQKSVDSAEAEPGEMLRYTISLVNSGNMNAVGVELRDDLPAEVQYLSGPIVSGSPYPGFWNGTGAIIWTGEIPANATVTLEYFVTVRRPLDDQTLISNWATLSYGGASAEIGPAETLVRSAPDLTTSTKTVDRQVANAGEQIEYTITLNNTGGMNAGSVLLTDVLPDDTSYSGGMFASAGEVSYADGTVTWTGAVLVDVPVTIRYRARLANTLVSGDVVSNLGTVDDGFAGHEPFDIGPAETQIIYGLSMSIDDGRDTVVPGDLLTYTIAYHGEDPVDDGVLTAQIPEHTQFHSATGNYMLSGNGYINWNLEPLASNFAGSMLLVVQVDPVLPDQTLIENAATFSGEGQSIEDNDTTVVTSAPNLSASVKEVSKDLTYAGTTLFYTITLVNNGTMNAGTALMLDPIPEHTTYVMDSVSGGSYDPAANAITWEGPLDCGHPLSVTYSVLIDEIELIPEGEYIHNVARVHDGYEGHDFSECVADTHLYDTNRPGRYRVYLPLVARNHNLDLYLPDLVVTDLVVTPAEPMAGEQVDIAVTIENRGISAAYGCFWIDLYINPANLPITINNGWYEAGSENGLVWSWCGLAAGESVTLYYGDEHYWKEHSLFEGWFSEPGTQVLYVQVDSWNLATTYGAVYELHDDNNVYGPQEINTGGTARAAESADQAQPAAAPPPRPNLPPR